MSAGPVARGGPAASETAFTAAHEFFRRGTANAAQVPLHPGSLLEAWRAALAEGSDPVEAFGQVAVEGGDRSEPPNRR